MKKSLIIFTVLISSGFALEAMAASSSTPATTTPQRTTEAVVREYFADIPMMIEIARCESKFRQFTDSDNVLRGGAGNQMVGVFQFFDRYHENQAEALGFDITTLEGNLAYARHVYTTEGTDPWSSSQDCWDTSKQNTETDTVVSDAVLRQKIALLQQIIALLQQLVAAQAGQSVSEQH